jgi:hypothetical protein
VVQWVALVPSVVGAVNLVAWWWYANSVRMHSEPIEESALMAFDMMMASAGVFVGCVGVTLLLFGVWLATLPLLAVLVYWGYDVPKTRRKLRVMRDDVYFWRMAEQLWEEGVGTD